VKWLFILALFLPRGGCLVDEVDVIEVNHVFDGEGTETFVQAIFWRWRGFEGHYRVVDWRTVRDGNVYPVRRWDRGGVWVSRWRDDRDRCWREVRAPLFRETWTVYDVEVADREFLPERYREGLSGKKVRW